MWIDHLAIWTFNLEGLRNFYMRYFDATSTEIYYNHSREFSSYFLLFDDECRLEIMEMPKISTTKNNPLKHYSGLAHFAIKAGSKTEVNPLTSTLTFTFPILKSEKTTIPSESVVMVTISPNWAAVT